MAQAVAVRTSQLLGLLMEKHYASSLFTKVASVLQASWKTERPAPNAYRLPLVKCTEPKIMMGKAFPCGKCLACRANRNRTWAHRIMLEAELHPQNAFLTLTYADEHLPVLSNGRATLVPEDARDWLKRLRKKIEPTKVRYFLVGEYGDETNRPHYHVALFNFPACSRGTTGLGSANPNWSTCCVSCRLVGETWGKGNVYLGSLERDSAQYISGYVLKKMTRRDDSRLDGRDPEFARMSLKPGLGAHFMDEVASTFMEFNLEQTQVDVPSTLRHGNKQWPLGRYLQRRLRKLVGRDEKTPQAIIDKAQEEVRHVREAAFDASESFQEALSRKMKPVADGNEARAAIYRKRKSI